MMIAQHISKWPPYSRHVEFRNDPKNNNTLSAMVPGHFHRVSTKLHLWNLRRILKCVFQDGGHGGHLGFRTGPKSNNTWSASSQDHVLQVSTKSPWWNLRSSKHEVYIGMMIAQHISKWPPCSRHVEFRNDPKHFVGYVPRSFPPSFG